MNVPRLAFIGSGNMASSLVAGLIADAYPPDRIQVSDVNPDSSRKLADRYGVIPFVSNTEVIKGADLIVLAVKPQVAQEVLVGISSGLQGRDVLLISILAGVHSHSLTTWSGGCRSIVRAMPNTPAMVQCGATGLYATPEVSETQRGRAESILRAVGLTVWVHEESLIDVITALSGSGPAYYFLLMEAMADAATALGLDQSTAMLLAQQTALGAGRMAIESEATPRDLRRQVTSPGGTTERAIGVFEAAGFHGLVFDAMKAAALRAAQLSGSIEGKPEIP